MNGESLIGARNHCSQCSPITIPRLACQKSFLAPRLSPATLFFFSDFQVQVLFANDLWRLSPTTITHVPRTCNFLNLHSEITCRRMLAANLGQTRFGRLRYVFFVFSGCVDKMACDKYIRLGAQRGTAAPTCHYLSSPVSRRNLARFTLNKVSFSRERTIV